MQEKWKRIDDEKRSGTGESNPSIPACMKSKEPVGETPLIGHKIMLLYTTKVFQYKP
jgi:hypothetical protein